MLGEVIRAAVNSNTLADARNVAGVLHKRLSLIVTPLVPLPQKPWTDRPRQFDEPEIAEHEARTAAGDGRTGRSARRACCGNLTGVGAPSAGAGARRPTGAAGLAAAGQQDRHLPGAVRHRRRPRHHRQRADRQRPEMRAAWHDAFISITRGNGVEVRALPDCSLIHMRNSYKTETGWAPPHVGKQLRDVRLGADTMRFKAIRAEAEARTAHDQAVAARHADIAAKARALEAQHREHEVTLAAVMEDRNLWDQLAEGPRRLAVQADEEYRRRYPGRKIRPLESAEPKVPDEPEARPGWLADLDEQRRVFRQELEARQNVMVPAEDPDWEDQGPAWTIWQAQRDAILQPPKPQLWPAEGVLEAARQRDTQPETELEGV